MTTTEDLVRAAMQRGDWFEAERLSAALDITKPRPSIVSAALFYAEIGLKVFPLRPHSKMPHRGTRGLKEASSDRDQIIAWWIKWPASNVAIATGHLVDVVDIDGIEGITSWARVTNLPASIGSVSTPRAGGSHFYLPATGRGNKAGIFPGIDYRGQGGYVVAPPSINDAGVVYRWRTPLRYAQVGK